MPKWRTSAPPEPAAGQAPSGRNWAERLARCHLEAGGLEFLAANHTEKSGELDLVFREGIAVVFVEVRQRRSDSYGSAAESIDARKLQRMRQAARLYLLRTFGSEDIDCRFDAVLVSGQQHNFSLQHLRGIA